MQTLIDELLMQPATDASACSAKDFKSPLDVRWCAGCGDYAVLAQVQKILPELGVPKEDVVFISGIGCSSRLPYYMDTYGFHTIHGRASAVATGLKIARPDLSVWVVTGDGDALSIGGNHNIHLLRRNVNINVLMLNNEIYGLTKGQYSPTSRHGQITKSSPLGALEEPFNPPALALGAGATFVARTLDRDLPHLRATLKRAAEHVGTSFVEVYQNCVVFNDGAFDRFTDKTTKPETALFLEHGKPLVFGSGQSKGIALQGLKPVVLDLQDGSHSVNDVLVYDETDATMAYILAAMSQLEGFPRPFGVFRAVEAPVYDDLVNMQITASRTLAGDRDLYALLQGSESWLVEA